MTGEEKMIFYFSGTGNSLSIALKMAETGEQLVNMAKARDEGAYKYSVKRGEKVGFIFPVYCYTINDIVLDFVRHLEITGHRYVWKRNRGQDKV
jgi:flavodoxin